MIIVPPSASTPALPAIQYLDLNIYDLLQALIDRRRVLCPSLTDESLAETSMQMLNLDASMADFLVQHINRAALDTYLPTVTSRLNLKRICAGMDYELGEPSAASVAVTFNCEDGHPEFTIPQGSQDNTIEAEGSPAIIFETDSDQIVTVGTESIDINCVQGYTVNNEILGSSGGIANEVFYCAKSCVLDKSETVEVLDGDWEEWTRVDDFVDSASDDKHYIVGFDTERNYYIIFGDGINGKIPASGSNNIRVTYRVGGGSIGNVAAGTIIELSSPITYVESVANTLPATGGTDEESFAHAQKYAPGILRAGSRVVSIQDIKNEAESYVFPFYGRVVKAAITEVGTITAQIRIVPASGGLPSAGLKQALKEYLEEKRVVCNYLDVLNPIYKVVDLVLDLYILDSKLVATVVQAVQTALINYLSPVYQDPGTGLYPHEFGRDVHLSELYDVIQSVVGVDHCDITTPSANVTVADSEIVNLGTLEITAYQGGQNMGYFNLETDL